MKKKPVPWEEVQRMLREQITREYLQDAKRITEWIKSDIKELRTELAALRAELEMQL